MNKKWILIVSLIQVIAYSSFASPTEINFIRGSLMEVQHKALAEGKLYFVDFTASWCTPCQWMDQTTFTDARVAQYIDANYLAVKVDIDDFDGFVYKEKFEVKVLPTIIIFNSKGEIVERYEETLPPSRMLEILSKHNTSQNRGLGQQSSFAYSNIISTPKVESEVNKVNNSFSNFDRMIVPVYGADETPHAPVMEAPEINIPSEYQSSTNFHEVPEFDFAEPAAPVENTAADLYRFNVQEQKASGFSVQVGAYTQYGNVLREVAKFQELTDEPVLVKINETGSKTVYKVLIGEFEHKDWALSLKEDLRKSGIDAFIKNLSQL